MHRKLVGGFFLLLGLTFMVGTCFGGLWYLTTRQHPKYVGLVLLIISELLLLNWFGFTDLFASAVFINSIAVGALLLYFQEKYAEEDSESDTLKIHLILTIEPRESANRFDKLATSWTILSLMYYAGWIYWFAMTAAFDSYSLKLSIFMALTTTAFAMMLLKISGGKKSKFWEAVKKIFTLQVFKPLASPTRIVLRSLSN